MFNGHDPFQIYAQIVMYRLIQKVKKPFRVGGLMTEGAVGRLALMLNPAIVVGLTYEESASLTRAILLSHWSSTIVVFASGVFILGLLGNWIKRYLFCGGQGTRPISVHLVHGLGITKGIIASIAASAPDPSPTLIIGYTGSSLLCFWYSAVISREVNRNE